MRDNNKRIASLLVALAVTACLCGVGQRGVVAGPPDNIRTFEVTVDGDKDGKRVIGTATATLDSLASTPKKTVYKLVRDIAGDSSRYARGTATVLLATHTISVEFDATPGITGALTGRAASPGLINLSPHESADEFIFSGQWVADGLTLDESWRELTHLMPGITILTPKGITPVADTKPEDGETESDPGFQAGAAETAAVGPVVDFSATVSIEGTDHVEFFVDGNLIASFKGKGPHEKKRLLNTPGWRRFIVKAYGAATPGNPHGLLGESDVTFLSRGLILTPDNGATIHANHALVEATPVGLEGVAMIDFCLDGKDVATKKGSPFALELPFATHGAHKVQAVAFDASGKELARTTASLNVVMDGHGDTVPPPRIDPSRKVPTLQGRPTITQMPAYPGNYRNRHGATRSIHKIVIHKAEGSLDATTSWFRNPASRVSAHYCVDDHRIAQMVDDNNIAWHTGSSDNATTIGIENSGFTHRDDMTDAHYDRLAQLVAWLCHKHGITPSHGPHRGSGTIIGHNEIKNPHWPGRGVEWGGAGGHEDPGPFWDWAGFMAKVEQHYQRAANNPSISH